MAVTGHFIHKGILSSRLLTFVGLSDSHARDFSYTKMKKHVIDGYPDMRIICAVTDNGSCLVLTSKKLNIEHVLCYLHTI